MQKTIQLENGEVHVWRANLEIGIEQLERYARLLCKDELARAARFRFDQDRSRFIAARGVLRELVALHTGQSVNELRIFASPHGKPYVDAGFGIHFNVSHSEKRAAYAFARAPVGIDIEAVRFINDLEQVAQHFFSSVEIASLNRYSSREQMAAFYRCWTRKEALIKQTGMGLSLPLDTFGVSLDPAYPELLHFNGHSDPQARWTISNILINPGYAGALVTEAPLTNMTEEVWDHEAAFAGVGLKTSRLD